MHPPSHLLLIPRHQPSGWLATAVSGPSRAWMGGLTREGQLIQQPCLLERVSPFAVASTPELVECGHGFSYQEWERRCQCIQEAFGEDLTKVVLARPTTFRLERGSPADLLASMAQANCSSLLLSQPDGSQWIATTPEVLFRREGGRLFTEALAGTLRAEGPDDVLLSRLLACPRRVAEVQITAEAILQALATLGAREARHGPLQLRRFRDWAHLCIPIEAEAGSLADEELLRALHPSPAVCGAPRLRSGAMRRAVEGVTRGWYAGACGISCPDWALFVVVLRCAEVRDHTLEAWAGVGLVPGFYWAEEWQELDLKLAGWRRFGAAASPAVYQ